MRGLEPDHRFLPRHLDRFRESAAVRTETPFFLGPPGAAADERCVALAELLEAAAPEGHRLLADNLRRLEGHVHRLASELEGPADAEDLLRRAGEAMLAELSLGEEDGASLADGLATLLEAVPAGGRLAPFRRRLPLDLMRQELLARGADARGEALADVRGLRSDLEGLLAADDRRRGAGDAAALAGSLGKVGSSRIRSDSLSGIVDRRSGGEPLDDALRRRLDGALEALASVGPDAEEPVLCVTDGALTDLLGVAELSGWRVVVTDDPCREAGERFEAAAEAIARVVRAKKLVRLACDGRYESARHDDWLERLDWQGLSPEELALAPAVVALASAYDVVTEGMLSLSSLLLSGRPVQVVVLVRPGSSLSPSALEGEDALSGFRFEPGYQGLGHREAFVAQTSPARPLHMATTFRRAAAATRTALHVVAEVPQGDRPPGPFLRAAAALEGRAHALFRYDPEAGATWARRLDFSDNPGPDLEWAEDEEAGVFTFAHYALTEPGYARHFCPVPEGADEAALAPLADWLGLAGEERAGIVPTIEAADGRGVTPLAVSRRLALASGDRLSYWRTLQELAGVRSEYADRAATEARREAEERARAEAEGLAERHAAELARVKATAVREAAERITSALLDVDPAVFEDARSPLERFAGGDADEVSRHLLEMLGDADEASAPAPEGGSDDADLLAGRLMQLIEVDGPSNDGLSNDGPSNDSPSNEGPQGQQPPSGTDASPPDDGRREQDQP